MSIFTCGGSHKSSQEKSPNVKKMAWGPFRVFFSLFSPHVFVEGSLPHPDDRIEMGCVADKTHTTQIRGDPTFGHPNFWRLA